MNGKPPQVTDLKEAQLLINQLWADAESLTEKIHLLEKQVKEQKGKLSKNSKNSSKPPVFFKIVGTVYPNFVKRLLPVRFLYFPSLDLMKQALPVGNF
jgi:hypothetical protein